MRWIVSCDMVARRDGFASADIAPTTLRRSARCDGRVRWFIVVPLVAFLVAYAAGFVMTIILAPLWTTMVCALVAVAAAAVLCVSVLIDNVSRRVRIRPSRRPPARR